MKTVKNTSRITYPNIHTKNIFKNLNGGLKENIHIKGIKMLENGREEDLYSKYMAFNRIMLEEYETIEVAAIMIVQALSFYRTIMNEQDYQSMVKSIYDKRDSVHTLD